MRIEEVYQNNQNLKKLPLNTEEGRQKAMLFVMTDISESLAMLIDLYGVVHGRVVSSKGEKTDGK